MDCGQVSEMGSHEQLLSLHGKYYDLWSLQQRIPHQSNDDEATQSGAMESIAAL